MDLKNLPITPLPSVKLDKHQEDLLLHNELFSNLLGETIFRYAGLHIYEVTEKLKEASSKYYKTQKQEARKNLSSFCSDLTDAEILRVIRSFSIFSALANIAEDVYQTHEQRYAKISNKLQIGSLEKSLKNLKNKGISQEKILKAMEKVSIVPVLTAHPTQVQRKSILDLTKKLTDILDKYENVKLHQIDENEWLNDLSRGIQIWWQTAMLRATKLRVTDEISNALSYYNITFFNEIPRLMNKFQEISKTLGNSELKSQALLPLTMGMWIGGDRDGNPYVTVNTLEQSAQDQAIKLFQHYLDVVREIYRDLSMSIAMTNVTEELQKLADASGEVSPHRTHEPYRRALTAIRDRLLATAYNLCEYNRDLLPPKRKNGVDIPYKSASEFTKDLVIVAESLKKNNSEFLTQGKLNNLISATKIFGFHLATIDLRQDSSVHEVCVAELLKSANILGDYLSLSEDARCEILLRELEYDPRILSDPTIPQSETLASELAIYRKAKSLRDRFGDKIIEKNLISHATSVSDMLEIAILLKEANLAKGNEGNEFCDLQIVPLFETVEDLVDSQNYENVLEKINAIVPEKLTRYTVIKSGEIKLDVENAKNIPETNIGDRRYILTSSVYAMFKDLYHEKNTVDELNENILVDVLNANGVGGYARKTGELIKTSLGMKYNAANYETTQDQSYVILNDISKEKAAEILDKLPEKYFKIRNKSSIPTLANIVVIIGSEKQINFKIDIYANQEKLKDASEKLKKAGYGSITSQPEKEDTEQSIIEYNKEDYFIALKIAKILGISDMVENSDLENKIGITIK